MRIEWKKKKKCVYHINHAHRKIHSFIFPFSNHNKQKNNFVLFETWKFQILELILLNNYFIHNISVSFLGKISFRNLKRVAKELGENMTDEELQEMIGAYAYFVWILLKFKQIILKYLFLSNQIIFYFFIFMIDFCFLFEAIFIFFFLFFFDVFHMEY